MSSKRVKNIVVLTAGAPLSPGVAPMNGTWAFDGDFDLLPIRAGVLYGPVPEAPTKHDYWFALRQMLRNRHEPAAVWRFEAVRERMKLPGAKLTGDTLKGINDRVARRLYRLAREQ